MINVKACPRKFKAFSVSDLSVHDIGLLHFKIFNEVIKTYGPKPKSVGWKVPDAKITRIPNLFKERAYRIERPREVNGKLNPSL